VAISTGAQIAVLAVLSVGLMALAVWIVLQVRGNPEKRERKRRFKVNRHGRLGDAIITEATENSIFYSYSLRGVQYTASQDVTTLREHLPAEPHRLVGIASLKYDTNNPANSILICEEWSGLRAPIMYLPDDHPWTQTASK
jgi:hypothetical protein